MEHAKQATLAEKLDSINEYEREPVPESQTKKFKSFLGMMAGEHIAGTEFVIGPLFVLHGAAAGDIFLGLLVGNILATLSWTLVCAPVAVKTRLTIYYQLEKICGRRLVSIFNAINGFQSCALAASMIAVSATAVALFFNMPVPGLTDLYPNSFSWIVAVALIGAVITVVTIFGYDRVAQFSGVCAPWMPLVFLAAGLSALPALGVSSISDFWQVAQDKIWTGVPQPGQTKYTFWHIVIFAWLCNSAMHIGMSDMSLYRYAKKASYGLASAAGMFIGHYMAWIASGILCALALQGGNTNPSPGQIAFGSAGIAGIVCVVVAGWTTANPTIYRAGLALQALMPQVKRWKVTLYVGIIASLLACLPAVVSKLDEVLGVYALFVAPVGAVILLDVYVFPKLNLRSNYAEKRRIPFNWVVAVTWVVSMLAGYALYVYTKADFFFFMAVPCWFIAAFLYILLSKLTQQKEPVPAAAQAMRK
jgi:purine-cytosine permease-like protein